MRLTLRTLIAYLDDELQPDQAKEIGQKLTESSYATALVDRIKEVMRRRRLSAPELFGKGAGLDPNLVAEYLDSELTPAEVVDVEKICLDSDMHLAEVAACHQILTLVLGDPVEVRQETRSRMYGLGPVAIDDVVRANDFMGALPADESRSIPMIASSASSSHSGSADHALPDYLQPQTSWKRSGMLALVLLIGVGWINLLMRDPTMNSRLRPGARPEGESSSSDKTATAPGDLPGANVAKTPDSSKVPQLAQLNPANSSKPRDVRVAAPKELPEIEPELAPPKPIKPLPTPPQPVEPANKPAVEPDEAPLAKVLPAQKLVRVSKDGILLRFDSEAHDFVVLPKGAELKSGDRLACPEPFRADLVVGDDLCLVALNGGTALRTLGPDEHAALGFDVEQGALLFEARSLMSAEEEPNPAKPQKPSLPITLLLHGQRTRLELVSDDAVCGLEVHRHEPTRFETDLNPPSFTASLYVARGSIRFINADVRLRRSKGRAFCRSRPMPPRT